MVVLKQHPLSAAFPAMQADEYQGLKDSIENNGVLEPITVFDGMILDGWHRYNAAMDVGMPCPMVELGADVDPGDFVLVKNKDRRNLTASQKAAAVTAVHMCRPAHRPNKSAPGADLLKSTKELAAMAGVGERTIEQAKAVHVGAVPAVQDAVKTGAVSVKVAAAVARLSPEEQEQIAAKGPDAMRSAAKSAAKQALGKVASSGNSSSHLTKAQADQLAQDAHGDDSDPVALLEEALAENDTLRKELAALIEADDQKAEILKWRRLVDVATRRQNELMDTVNARERELRRLANWLRRIGNAVDEENPSKIAAIVEAKFRVQKSDACDLPCTDDARTYQ
jgi:hypothetical protein